MELLLVLAILVVAAAAVMPSFRGAMRNSSLRAAADTVRTELTKAHVLAMRTGRIQVFHYEQNGGKYKTEPWLASDEELDGPPPDGGPAAVTTSNEPPKEPALPEGIVFGAGDSEYQARSQQIEEELSSVSGAGAMWSRPILFYPDGSTMDAFIVVANERGAAIRIDLRGLTAAVKVSDITDQTELESTRAAWQQQ